MKVSTTFDKDQDLTGAIKAHLLFGEGITTASKRARSRYEWGASYSKPQVLALSWKGLPCRQATTCCQQGRDLA